MQTTVKSFLSITLATAFTAWVAYPQAPATPSGTGTGKVQVFKGKGVAKSDWPPEGPTPRTADGKPDLTGNWQPNAIQENVDLASRVEIPFQPWAAEVHKEHKANISKDDPEARCLPPGVPRMSTTPYPWSIIQTPKEIVIVYEGGAHIWRKIFMDGRPHDPNVVDTWLGDSIGHWEGDTLVVETVGQTDRSWLDQAGVPHSADMKVTERITRTDLGHMEIVHIIDDPKTFTKTWTFTTHPTLLKGELIEYICQENNKDLEHLVGKSK